MNLKDIKDYFVNILVRVLIVMLIVFLTLGIINTCKLDVEEDSSPVEESRIDSISNANAKIIIEVEHIDSIKDAKVIEVKSLDNDSTLKLFYQLIGK